MSHVPGKNARVRMHVYRAFRGRHGFKVGGCGPAQLEERLLPSGEILRTLSGSEGSYIRCGRQAHLRDGLLCPPTPLLMGVSRARHLAGPLRTLSAQTSLRPPWYPRSPLPAPAPHAPFLCRTLSGHPSTPPPREGTPWGSAWFLKPISLPRSTFLTGSCKGCASP